MGAQISTDAELAMEHMEYRKAGPNRMIDFSIIFPSRDHEDLLLKLFVSLSRNTAHLEKIEVLVAIDEDDPNMESFTKRYSFTFVKFFKTKRSLNFSRDYYTFLFKQSRGRWIIACNDDAEFITPQWDITARDMLESYIKGGPNIVYGWIEDMLGKNRLTQFGQYCCFPLIGRDGIIASGYVFPHDIPTWGADIWIEQLYRNIGRIIQLPIVIKHVSIHNGLRQPDAIHYRIAANQVPVNQNPRPDQINVLIAALRAPYKEPANA